MKKPKNHIFRGPNSKNSPFPFLVWKKSIPPPLSRLGCIKICTTTPILAPPHEMRGCYWIRNPTFPLLVVKKKKTEKVFNLGNGYYSVHTNQIYRTVCHVPSGMMTKYCISASVDYYIQGMPPSCAFKACIVEKELCERNNAEDELLLDDLRLIKLHHYLHHHSEK